MSGICYSDSISAVATNDQLLGKTRACAKFQKVSSKTEELVCYVQTDRQTGEIGSGRPTNHL